jgi:hypothetical protein
MCLETFRLTISKSSTSHCVIHGLRIPANGSYKTRNLRNGSMKEVLSSGVKALVFASLRLRLRSAGSGKSMLAYYKLCGGKVNDYSSIAIDHLEELHLISSAVGFVYFDYKEQEKQTCTKVAANLLKQLITTSLHESTPCSDLLETMKARFESGRLGGIRELGKFIIGWIDRIPGSVFLVFDALDEWENKTTQHQLLKFISQLRRNNVRILVTSRHSAPAQWITENITVRANDYDIETFVRAGLESRRIAPSLTDEIVRAIILNARGMLIQFFLSNLRIGSFLSTFNLFVCRQVSATKMRQTLKHLPTDLDGAFEDVLDPINSKVKEARDLAFAALGWVLFSARPLTTSELSEALSIEGGSSARDPENVVEERQVSRQAVVRLIWGRQALQNSG